MEPLPKQNATSTPSTEVEPFNARRRFSELRFLQLSFFGFAFIRAWNDVAFFHFSQTMPGMPPAAKDLFILAMVVAVFLPGIPLARKLAPLYRKPCAVAVSVALLLASTLLWFVSQTAPETASFLMLASIVTGGAGAALSILLWAELQSCFDAFHMVLYVSGSFFLGSVLAWFLIGLDPVRSLLALATLPLLSLLCLKAGYGKVPAIDLPKRTWGKVRFPWGLVVVLGIYQFVFGLRSSSVAFGAGSLLWGTMVVALALFAAVYFFSHRFDFTMLFRTPFVLMTCGLLLELLAFSVSNQVADFCIAAGYSLMFLMMTILLCDLSHRYGVSVLVLCGIQELTNLGLVAGRSAAAGIDSGAWPFSLHDPAVTAVLAMLIVVATLALFSGKRGSMEWGATFFGLHEKKGEEGLAERCEEVGRKSGLSPREREVLQYLAAGKSAPYIERELCIANGTLKSHTRRIYVKLDVHSRDELRKLLDCQADRQPGT